MTKIFDSDKTLLVNYSNIPSEKWSEEFIDAAHALGFNSFIDVPFVEPEDNASKDDYKRAAVEEIRKIREAAGQWFHSLYIDGDPAFSHILARAYFLGEARGNVYVPRFVEGYDNPLTAPHDRDVRFVEPFGMKRVYDIYLEPKDFLTEEELERKAEPEIEEE